MGVPEAWTLIEAAQETCSLQMLTVQDGFSKNRDGARRYKLGVDISIWFAESQSAFKHGGAQSGSQPELKVIFYRLAGLLMLPVDVLFVFDGSRRPDIKRNTKVTKKAHWLTEKTKLLIKAFGFSFYVAPGEAEAELAQLNEVGVIDAVVTTDFDALLFGAKTVITMSDKDSIRVHRAQAIAETPTIQLGHGGLILIAALSGSDYSPGVKGCGIDIAHALAKCGYGEELLYVVKNATSSYEPWFNVWIKKLQQELQTNSRGFLKQCAFAVARRLPTEFPSLDIIKLHVNPIVNDRDSVIALHIPHCAPDVCMMVTLCRQLFTFGEKQSTLQSAFRNSIWHGLVTQLMTAEAVLVDQGSGHQDPSRYSMIGFDSLNPLPFHLIREKHIGLSDAYYLVRVSGEGINDLIATILDSNPGPQAAPIPIPDLPPSPSHSDESPPSQLTIQIPSIILEAALPECVNSHYSKLAKQSTRFKDNDKPLIVARSCRRHTQAHYTESEQNNTIGEASSDLHAVIDLTND